MNKKKAPADNVGAFLHLSLLYSFFTKYNFMSSTHKNSRIVTIFRSGSFLSRAQTKEIEEFLSTTKRSIGSYWESTSSKRVGTGLTFSEESLLLPLVLDVPAEDREFRKKVTDFYVDIDTQIPHGTGRQLEIGLDGDNTKEVSGKNMPLNIMDYLRYKQILGHPNVAPSREEAEGNTLIQFYVFDKSDAAKKNIKRTNEKDDALTIYLELKNDPDKVNSMLTVMGVDPREYSGPDAEADKQEALREISIQSPVTFISSYKAADLDIRYWIKTMINTGVFKQIGAKLLDAETNKIIGNSEEEVVFYFKDDENSEVVAMLKARTQEALKKPLTGRKKARPVAN